MTDEIFGFRKKDGRFNDGHRKDVFFIKDWVVTEDKLVPVRLRSESVSLAWLEAEIKRRCDNFQKINDEDDTIGCDGEIVLCSCDDCETRAGRILELESLKFAVRLEAESDGK